MKRVVIIGASRTPFGRFRGSLASLSPVELASAATGSALSVCDSTKVDQVFLGNVLSAGQGMNIARQVVRDVGLPLQVAATTVNMMCGSGLQAVRLGVAAIRSGEANVVLCGGCESMSASGMHVPRPRKGEKLDPQTALDLMQRDGLTDPETGEHMAIQTERLAQSDGISRTQQDEFALRSQQLYQAAKRDGVFAAEIAGLPQLAEDEHPRDQMSLQDLRSLRPGFHEDGSITAGNSSGINDGAAILIVSDREYALSQGWPVLCEWVDSAVTGCDPNEMGLGPVFAIRRLFERNQLQWRDIDHLEINEAFAAQTLACMRRLELRIDRDDDTVVASGACRLRMNSSGGAIAIGHPLAASGARLGVHLSQQIAAMKSRKGIVSLCIGGGMGIAALLQRHE